jgi:hypothetical protein
MPALRIAPSQSIEKSFSENFFSGNCGLAGSQRKYIGEKTAMMTRLM